MRKFVKKFVALSCVMSTAAMCLAVTASAANPTATATYDKAAGVVTVEGYQGENGKQATVMVITEEKWNNIQTASLTADDIFYINQDEAAALKELAEGKKNVKMGTKGTLANGTYVALFGGENIEHDGITVAKFEVKDTTPADVKVTSITLDKTTAEITVGGNTTLTATVEPDNATNKTVNWTSDKTEIATVNNGVVTAVAAGTAVITATAADGSGVSASCTVTVKPGEVEKQKVTSFTKENDNAVDLPVGGNQQLGVVVEPTENVVDYIIEWKTSDASKVTVDQSGNVTAVAAGTADITATMPGTATASGQPIVLTWTVSVQEQGGDEDFSEANYGKTWAYLADVDYNKKITVTDAVYIQLSQVSSEPDLSLKDENRVSAN